MADARVAPETLGERVALSFEVNGETRKLRADPFARLSWVLREELGLTGTKVGCDAGDCGACTVLLDGEQVCACLVSAAQVQGRQITTVEGPAEDETLARLRRSFLEHGAAQCGICTPGMLMAARDLLEREPHPERRQVEDALGGVLCRCTGYLKIVDAVIAAGGPEVRPRAHEGDAVGARLPRADGEPRVEGSALYGADAAPPDALWLRAVRSPHPRARFEIGALEPLYARHPGLVRVLTGADVPENSFGIYPDLKDQPVLAEGQVRFRGEAVLALVGEHAAIEAIDVDEIPIRWLPESPVVGIDAATAEGAPNVHAEHPDNVLIRGNLERGDVREGFAAAAAEAAGAWTTAFVEHAYIEPEAGFAQRVGDRMEVVASTQTPYMDRDEVARVLGLEPEAVRIVPTACGGGFGGKLDIAIQPLLAVAAWILERPVRGVYARIESMSSSTKRHPARIEARMAADADGRITAYTSSADFNTGAYASWGPTVAGRVPVHAAGPYRVPHVHNRSRAIYTNENPSGAFRGFGVPQSTIAHETLLDDLALALGMDRLAIRHCNALRTGDTTASGQVLEASCGLAACLDAVRDEWHAMLARSEAHNRDATRLRRGVGIGCMWYGCGNTALSNPSTLRVTLDADGELTLYNGAVDIGQGSTTILLQICADAAGLPPASFNLVIGDTDRTEDAGKTSASRQTFVSGKAAYLAGRALREQILAAAKASDEARLHVEGSHVVVSEDGARKTLDLRGLRRRGKHVFEGIGHFDPPTTPLDASGQGTPYATYAFAAHLCELLVDVELGTVELLKIVAAHDVGRAINPTLVEGQIQGGIAQGIGMALLEEYLPGVTENLHDYLIPTFGDMPEIEIALVEDPEPLGPYGAKGVGEPALIPTPPAILGAIRHATGVRLEQIPALPHRVRAALLRASEAS